jgi:formylmethanofuran dehydrogenase subunit E
MQDEQIREALNRHWQASAAGDANAEHDMYDDDAICDYPSQASESSGETICRPCGVIIQASRQASTSGEFSEKAPRRGQAQHREAAEWTRGQS